MFRRRVLFVDVGILRGNGGLCSTKQGVGKLSSYGSIQRERERERERGREREREREKKKERNRERKREREVFDR